MQMLRADSCRLATSLTVTPAANDAATIRAFSSGAQRRRRSIEVTTSTGLSTLVSLYISCSICTPRPDNSELSLAIKSAEAMWERTRAYRRSAPKFEAQQKTRQGRPDGFL